MRFTYFFSILVMISLNHNSHASNFQWLSKLSVKYYSTSEIQRMYKNAETLLDSGQVGDSQSWQGDTSENHGTATITKALSTSPMCKMVRIVNDSKNYHGDHEYKFCKHNEEWKLIDIF